MMQSETTTLAEPITDVKGPSAEGKGEQEGTLQLNSERSIPVLPLNSEGVTAQTFALLQKINTQSQILTDPTFTHLTAEDRAEMEALQKNLGNMPAPSPKSTSSLKSLSNRTPQPSSKTAQEAPSPKQTTTPGHTPPQKKTFSSIFSMASAFSQRKAATPKPVKTTVPLPPQLNTPTPQPKERTPVNYTPQFQDGSQPPPQEPQKQDRNYDQEQGHSQHQQQDDDQEQSRHQHPQDDDQVEEISNVQAGTPPPGDEEVSMDSVFMRFMAIMMRISHQTEAQANELYNKIKTRTDNIDKLIELISKINSEEGDIDWSDNEEMKELIQQVRDLGVDIPEGKYSWKESEKALLKENIHMRKESLEHITQLERSDMQRFLQTVSHCHQSLSNILKLIKEIGDTFVHNIRP